MFRINEEAPQADGSSMNGSEGAPIPKTGRKRGQPGSTSRVVSAETMSMYEKAFLMASQRNSGHIFKQIVGIVFD